jgi:hypothetical protein
MSPLTVTTVVPVLLASVNFRDCSRQLPARPLAAQRTTHSASRFTEYCCCHVCTVVAYSTPRMEDHATTVTHYIRQALSVFPSCLHTSRSSWLTPSGPPSRQGSHGISQTDTPFHRKAENHQHALFKNPPGVRPSRFRTHGQPHARADHILRCSHLGATPRA